MACGAAMAIGSKVEAMALPSALTFEILREGSKIGGHQVAFQQNEGALTATTTVEIVVRFGPIALFRYNHTARELWRDGQFESLTSETNDDGTKSQAKITRTAENVIVEVRSRPRVLLPAETIPLTHWNVLCMRRPLVNPQTGLPITGQIVDRGEDKVTLSDGRMVPARHYSLLGKDALDDWYDATPIWTGLRSRAHDGSVIEYRRIV
jgi:hypothetical protein